MLLRKLTMLVLAITLAGCASRSVDSGAMDQLVEQRRDTAVTCPPERTDRCAMASPLHQLAMDDRRHHLMILDQGEAALITRVHMIRAARKQIFLQNYIVNDDAASRLLLGELIQAAQRGVQVKVLADALISMPDPELQAALEVAHENFQLLIYNPLRNEAVISNRQFFAAMFCCFRQLNHRMHNKIVSIDGEHAILGGRNSAGRYFDLDTRMNYLDYEVLVSGPVVEEIDSSFMEYWQHELARPPRHTRDIASALEQQDVPAEIAPKEERFDFIRQQASDHGWLEEQWKKKGFRVEGVEYFSDPPAKTLLDTIPPQRNSTTLLYNLITSASHSVVIQSPYLVLSDDLHDALQLASPAEVIISTNSLASTDAFPVYAISRRERHRLVSDLGLNVYEMKPFPQDINEFVPRYQTLIEEKEAGLYAPLRGDTRPPTRDMPGPRLSLHGKLLLIDDHTAVVTAHNFDPRSEVYNTENGIIVYDQAFTAALREFVDQTIAPGNSWVSLEKPRKVPLLGDLNQWLARGSRRLPTLDLWPGRLAQNYQQPDTRHDSQEQAPSSTLQAVGEFPEVRAGRRFFTGFLSRMFGFTKPLM